MAVLVRSVYLSVSSISVMSTGGNTITKEDLCLGFKWIRGGQKALPTSVDSQFPLVQNNPYTKMVYLGLLSLSLSC